MKGPAYVLEFHTGLWSMMLGAGVLAVLMFACAGTAAAMYQIPVITADDGGGADFTSIQAAVDAAGERAMVEMRAMA